MGASTQRLERTWNIEQREKQRQSIQSELDTIKSIEERRKMGQFATPIDLAKEIISYGLSLRTKPFLRFLEPAIGTGAFYSALLQCGA